jgi:hypothetical protein
MLARRILVFGGVLFMLIALRLSYIAGQTHPRRTEQVPFGLSWHQANLYRLQDKNVTFQVHIGYNSNSTVQQQMDLYWPCFGKITRTEDMGPLLGKDGTVIRATVRKHDCWD